MGSITILLGRSRWKRRRALPAQALSGVDPFGRPTFMVLTGTAAKRRAIEREFVDLQGAPSFAPSVRVFGELVHDLWSRHGDGRAIASPRVEALLAQDLLTDAGASWPWLHSLGGGPAVARALADLRADLDSARRRHVPGMAAELCDAVDRLRSRLAHLPGHTSRTAALEQLLVRLQRPDRALTQQLRATHSVILDDLLQPSPLERAVLIALCRAWSTAGAHVVFSLETGRDLGGAEAGLFFEYDDAHAVAYPLRPFRVSRGLRRALFQELVATGEADLAAARGGAMEPIEPGLPLGEPAPADLSDHLYGPRPVPVDTPEQARALLGGTLRLQQHADPYHELHQIAAQVKRALQGGARAHDCVVALPNLGARASTVRAAFRDHGVAIDLSESGRLAASPVATVALNVATLALRGFPVDQTLALLRSDLVASAAGLDIDILARWCRAAGLTDGPPGSWGPALGRWMDQAHGISSTQRHALPGDLAALDALVRPLESLARPLDPAEWRQTLLRQLLRLDVPVRAADARDSDGAATDNLDAWGAVRTALDELVRDLGVLGGQARPAEQLAQLLERTLAETPWRPHRQGGGAVTVLDVRDLRGLTPRHVWVGGLIRGAFPRPAPPAFLLPREASRLLETPDPAAEARYLLTSLLRNALDDRFMESVTLSWPETSEGKTAAPSPLIEDLLALPTRIPTPDGGGTLLLGDVLAEPSAPMGPSSQQDVQRLSAANPAWYDLLPAGDRPRAALQAQVCQARQASPGPWEGVLERAPEHAPSELSVTGLESYLQCPARFWYERLLHVQTPDPWDPDVASTRKGQVLHRILERFVGEHLGQPMAGDAVVLRRRLHEVAEQELRALALEGNAASALVEHHRQDWLAGLIDPAPAGVLCTWLDQELAEATVPLQVEQEGRLVLGPVTLTAKLDRLDRVPGRGVLVLDYKSGSPPSRAKVEQGLALQPIAYAAIAGATHPETPVATAFISLRDAEGTRRSGYVGHPDLMPRRGALPLEPAQCQALLDHAATGATDLHRGLVHTTLADPKLAGCSWCRYQRICRTRSERAAELLAGPHDLHRPVPVDGAQP